MAPRAVLMKTGLRPLNTARPVNTAHPKTIVYSARPMSHFSKSAQSTVKWPYQIRTTLTNKNFSQKVNTAKGKFYTAKPKAINIARPNSAVVNAVRMNQVNAVKASACWVWRPTKLNSASITLKRHNYGHPQKEDQGYVESGCSRYMTGNMSYLSELKEFDGGYVTFGGGAKGGKITSKGTLKTSKLDFEDVYFFKELQFTWVFFLATKDETSGILKSFITEVENLVDKKVKIIRCDNETEFKNRVMSEFCKKKGLKKEFSNRVLVVKPHNKALYELFRGRTPALSFMRPFGCHVTILNTLDYLGKFDGKFDEGFFIGYSLNSKAFRVYNIRTRKVEENLHIRFLEDKPFIASDGPKWLFDIDVLTKSMNYVPVVADGSLFDSSSKNVSNDEPQPSSDAGKKNDKGVRNESGIDDQEGPKNSTQAINTVGPSINTASINVNTSRLNINTVNPTVTTAPLEATHANFFSNDTEVDMSNITTTYLVPSTLNTRIHKDHSLDHVIGDVQSGVQTRRMTKTTNEQGFISAVYERKTHEDLHTCLFACFLSQEEPKRIAKALRHTQEEGIDYDEVFALIAGIEAIRLFLAYASFMGFMVYRIDVNSAFLYGSIEEEVYVCQPSGFEDPDYPDKVYKVVKALYGLHQALRAWYETLAKYLLDNGIYRGKIDKTLFIKRQKGDILLVQVYVDDIIFVSTKKELCTEFEKLMHEKF
ncbi:putative ribonuclease H-like domain-containing protein [Tanacetum coccineum]